VTAFVGIDLAWGTRNPSGICVVRCRNGHIRLDPPDCGVHSVASLARMAADLGPDVVIAIDGPIVVTNPTGKRRCESELDEVFRPYHALTHSTNTGRTGKGGPAGPALHAALLAEGFACDRLMPAKAPGRWALEVYPHASHVVGFGLSQRLLYKSKYKRSQPWRRSPDYLLAELWHYRELLALALQSTGAEGVEHLPTLPLVPVPERQRKGLEDRLDAVSCALIAVEAWRFGLTSDDGFGDAEHGYIAVPGLSRDVRFRPPTSGPGRSCP
jgi:predicted RNase H-like nuclease